VTLNSTAAAVTLFRYVVKDATHVYIWKSAGATSGVSLASTAPANVTRAAAAVGVGTTAARDDHKHDIAIAAPAALVVGGSAVTGSSSSLAAADHVHALAAFGTGAGTFMQGNQAAGGDSSGTLNALVNDTSRGLRETSGPTVLVAASIGDGLYVKRVGSTLVGATPTGGTGTLNMFLDAPSSPNTDDVEITADLAALGFSVYNTTDAVACTRAGDVNPWAQHTTNNTYRSTYRNGRILFQGPGPNKSCQIYKTLASIPNGDCFYTLVGTSMTGDGVTVNTSDVGRATISLWKTTGGLPDNGNRYNMSHAAGSGTDIQLQKMVIVASVPAFVPTLNSKLLPVPQYLIGLKFTASTGALPLAVEPISGSIVGFNVAADSNAALVATLDKWGWNYGSGAGAYPPFGTVTLSFLRRCATFPGMT
jgi:hypothetical protein